MRQIVLDTETTGLSTAQGHRIIEIGAIELVNRRQTGREFHRFLNPERDIDEGARARPRHQSQGSSRRRRDSHEIADELLEFITDAELVIHNAEFDVGFLEHELASWQHPRPTISDHAQVLDTLSLARELHPGQRNSLDALCKRYEVDASNRDLHGALIDSDLLARVYLAMTGGQTALFLDKSETDGDGAQRGRIPGQPAGLKLEVARASEPRMRAHEAMVGNSGRPGSASGTGSEAAVSCKTVSDV